MITRIAGIAVLLLALTLGAASGAANDEGSKRALWVERYRSLVENEATLRAELDEAKAAYVRGRRANKLRGKDRAELNQKIAKLEESHAKAERELADFPEKARKAGALPGWFRDP